MDGWTIGELTTEAARALGEAEAPNGRVTATPDLRMVRYYTTLGLLDRALEFRGRTAIYGRRHLLQIVAIKRLQAAGRSLAEVQQTLVGATDRKLEELAGPLATESTAAKATTSEPVEERFWEAVPAAAPAVPSGYAANPPKVRPSVRIEVAPGAAIVLDGVSPEDLSKVDWASIEPAIRRLASALSDAGLIQD